MPETLTKTIPFFIKLFALVVGGLISLVFSGDINLDKDNNAKLIINLKVILKITCAIGLGLFGGEFFIDVFNFEYLNYYAQALFYLIFSSFGMLIFGTVYRSWQLTTSDKTLAQIVAEIKNIAKALIK